MCDKCKDRVGAILAIALLAASGQSSDGLKADVDHHKADPDINNADLCALTATIIEKGMRLPGLTTADRQAYIETTFDTMDPKIGIALGEFTYFSARILDYIDDCVNTSLLKQAKAGNESAKHWLTQRIMSGRFEPDQETADLLGLVAVEIGVDLGAAGGDRSAAPPFVMKGDGHVH